MDSDDYSDASPSQPSRRMPRRAAKHKGPARLTRSSVAHLSQSSASDEQASFDEESHPSDDSDGTEEGEEDDFVVARGGQKRKPSQLLTAASKRPRRMKKSSKLDRSPPTPRRKARSRKSPAKSSIQKTSRGTDEQVIVVLKGDWQSLPYMVWENIFDFLAAPIDDLNAHREDVSIAVQTLRNATRASKILVEPALTARYRCVHLGTFTNAQDLSTTLEIDSEQTALKMRYRSKIETLRVEVGDTLSKKVQGQYVTSWDLIRNLPRLHDIELYHKHDLAYTRDELEANVRWKYPDDLFDALAFVPNESRTDDYAKDSPTKLRSWTWSSRLAGESCSLEKLAQIHQTPSFITLRKLKFINYQVPSLSTKVGDEGALAIDLPEIQKLAAAICALPNLEYLAFKSSTMVNGHLLSLLPKNLKHLELHDCYDVTAEALRDFLLTHGRWMQRLTLDHCRALSLGFLTVLKDACPNLTHLSMNLKYYRYIESWPDNEPDYDELLEPDQVPTWPRTLQYLNIQPIRWVGRSLVESATTFLNSLTSSAAALPNLRHVALKNSINISRPERYRLRDTWIPRMENVFKRLSADPRPVTRAKFVIPIQAVTRETTSDVAAAPARRSNRIAEQPSLLDAAVDEVAETSQREEAVVLRIRKETKRLRLSRRSYHADNEGSDDELSATGSGHTPAAPFFRQRLCDVVDIQIDNQKLSEYHFTEQDFIDTPNDDDEDEEYLD
ncbi:hypothetical protein SCAR479_04211 [Seiridium cardinale]|uniref:Uncharacterized protein n=1 Tax=Seiridium cardinale TaxID=138064 RepID=A0ABR2XZI5_9PEZI